MVGAVKRVVLMALLASGIAAFAPARADSPACQGAESVRDGTLTDYPSLRVVACAAGTSPYHLTIVHGLARDAD